MLHASKITYDLEPVVEGHKVSTTLPLVTAEVAINEYKEKKMICHRYGSVIK